MKKVLLVDDSATMLSCLRTALQLRGFDISTATDGVEAMKLLNAGLKPDLIITDINMPNMDGIELIGNVRKLLRFTPILALTTESQSTKRDEAKKLGATGWMMKPVVAEELAKLIKFCQGHKVGLFAKLYD